MIPLAMILAQLYLMSLNEWARKNIMIKINAIGKFSFILTNCSIQQQHLLHARIHAIKKSQRGSAFDSERRERKTKQWSEFILFPSMKVHTQNVQKRHEPKWKTISILCNDIVLQSNCNALLRKILFGMRLSVWLSVSQWVFKCSHMLYKYRQYEHATNEFIPDSKAHELFHWTTAGHVRGSFSIQH